MATTATRANSAAAPTLPAPTNGDVLSRRPVTVRASRPPAPAMAVVANDPRHRALLAGFTREKRLMRPGRASLPVGAPHVPPAELAARVVASGGHPYQGYAETRAGLGLPDLPNAGVLPSLLSTTTRMRTWYRGPRSWRTDVLTSVGERDQYLDADGTMSWDAGRRRATDVDGIQAVRLARPQDVLPPELGRRLVVEAAAAELSPLAPKRVAGRSVPGLRITPRATDTTVGRVDLWADAGSGVPLEVVVTPRGTSSPAIISRFLDVSLSDPGPGVVTFRPGPEARLTRDQFADVATALDRLSPLVLPDAEAGLARRGSHQGPALTYGSG